MILKVLAMLRIYQGMIFFLIAFFASLLPALSEGVFLPVDTLSDETITINCDPNIYFWLYNEGTPSRQTCINGVCDGGNEQQVLPAMELIEKAEWQRLDKIVRNKTVQSHINRVGTSVVLMSLDYKNVFIDTVSFLDNRDYASILKQCEIMSKNECKPLFIAYKTINYCIYYGKDVFDNL